MKKELFQEIEIPEGVEVKIAEGHVKVEGPQGEVSKEFNLGMLEMKKEGNRIVIGNKRATKREKKMMNTIKAHIQNMIRGTIENFEYVLKVCHSHFPITVEIKDKELIIKNFLGEKVNRKAKILDGVNIKVDKEIITLTSADRELAGQTAANIEKATKVSKRDRRIFQDGIFIISKAGKEI